jgi:hypothetical protein
VDPSLVIIVPIGGKPEGNSKLGKPRHKWEDNNKMELEEV